MNKAIDELIERYRMLSEKFKEDNTLIDIINDLETLKEQLKEQHKEDVKKAFQDRGVDINKFGNLYNVTAEQYYQQTHEKKQVDVPLEQRKSFRVLPINTKQYNGKI